MGLKAGEEVLSTSVQRMLSYCARRSGEALLLIILPLTNYQESLHAQALQWVNLNHYVAPWQIICLAKDRAGNLFAGTDNGIYKSTNHGRRWRLAGFLGGNVYAICVDSNNHVLAQVDQVWISTDIGITWTKTGVGFTSMAADRFGNIFGGSGSNGSGDENIWKSLDGGFNWNQVSSPPGGGVNWLAVDSSGALFKANGCYPNVYSSSDLGTTWTSHIYDHGWQSECDWGIFTLYLTPRQVLMIGDDKGRIEESTDSGTSWKQLFSNDSEPNIYSLLSNEDGSAILAGTTSGYKDHGGLLRTYDHGKTWARDTNLWWPGLWDWWVPSSSLLQDTGNLIHLGTSNEGIWDSYDFGRTWQYHISGATRIGSYALAQDPQDSTIFMGTDDGIFYSLDRGDTWLKLDTSLDERRVSSIAIPAHNVLIVSSHDSILLSSDNGKTWTAQRLALGPSAKLVWDSVSSQIYVYDSAGAIFVSRDTGRTWLYQGICVSSGDTLTIVRCSGRLLIGTSLGLIRESLDSARTWQNLGAGLGSHVNCLATDSSRIVAASNNGLFEFDTTTSQWRTALLWPQNLSVKWVEHKPENEWIVFTIDGGLYANSLSDTFGWHRFQQDLPRFMDIGIFNDDFVYAVCDSGEFFKSHDQTLKYGVKSKSEAAISVNIYPNPAINSCIVACDATFRPVRISLLDILGRQVPTNLEKTPGGQWLVTWNGFVPSGAYGLRLFDATGHSLQALLSIR